MNLSCREYFFLYSRLSVKSTVPGMDQTRWIISFGIIIMTVSSVVTDQFNEYTWRYLFRIYERNSCSSYQQVANSNRSCVVVCRSLCYTRYHYCCCRIIHGPEYWHLTWNRNDRDDVSSRTDLSSLGLYLATITKESSNLVIPVW